MCQSISPPGSNSAVNKERAVSMQDLSVEEYSISQSSAGSASDNYSSNTSSEKPSSSLKSSLKSLAKMVHRTLVVKRKVQLIDLKTVISSHRNWLANSEGYQNLFEFGQFAFLQSVSSPLKPIFNVVFSHYASAFFMLLFLVVLSLEMNIAESFTVNNVRAHFKPMSCLKMLEAAL